jgi:hypothetical protein
VFVNTVMNAAYLCAVVIAIPILPALLASSNAVDRFLGEWRGESICIQKNTACRDETVVYRIAKGESGRISVSADKIVNGAPVNMGILDFRHDPDRDELVSENAQGTWRLRIDGAKLGGTLTRSDGSLFRRVTLKQDGK